MNNVCIMALDKTLNAEGLQALDLLKNTMEDIFESVSAKAYSALTPMVSQLGEKLAQNKAVILAVSPSVFYNAKHGLSKALAMKLMRSDAVTAALPTAYSPKSREEYEVVTCFPADSRIFMTHNGFLAGFAMQSGKQTILFLPLETNRLFPMLRDEVCPFLRTLFPVAPQPAPAAEPQQNAEDDILFEVEELEPMGAPEDKPDVSSLMAAAAAAAAPETDSVSEAAGAEPVEIPAAAPPAANPASSAAAQVPAQEPPAALDPLTAALHRAVNALNSTGKCAGVALCGPAEGLRSLLNSVPGSRTAFIFDPEPAAKWNTGEFNPYFAEVARTTMERCGTDFAVAVSALYTDGEKNEKFMFFALATAQGARISKITDSADTAADVVASDCLQGMAEAVEAAVRGDGFAGAPANAAAPLSAGDGTVREPAESAAPVTVSKAPLIVAAVLLGVAIVAAVVLGFLMSGKETTAAQATTAPAAVITQAPLPETATASAAVITQAPLPETTTASAAVITQAPLPETATVPVSA